MSLRFLKLLVLDCLLSLLPPLLLASVYTMLWLPSDWRQALREKAQCLLLEKQGSLESQQEEGLRQGDLLLLGRDFEFCFVLSGDKSTLHFYSFVLRQREELRSDLCKAVGVHRCSQDAGGLQEGRVQPDPTLLPRLLQRRLVGDCKHIFPLSASFPPSFNIIHFLLAQKRSL